MSALDTLISKNAIFGKAFTDLQSGNAYIDSRGNIVSKTETTPDPITNEDDRIIGYNQKPKTLFTLQKGTKEGEFTIPKLRNEKEGGYFNATLNLTPTSNGFTLTEPEKNITGQYFSPYKGQDVSGQQWVGMSPQLASYLNTIQSGEATFEKQDVSYENGKTGTQYALIDPTGNRAGTLQSVPGRDDIATVKTYNQEAGGFLDLYVAIDPKTGRVAPVQDFSKQVTYKAPTQGAFWDQIAKGAKDAAPYAALVFGGPLATQLGGGLLGAAGSSALFQAVGGTPVDKIAENIAKGAVVGGVVGADGLDISGSAGGGLTGQLAQSTAGNLIAGQNLENAVTGAVKSVSIGSLTSPSIPTDTTAFDTTTDIPDNSGFDIPTAMPQTPITGNTGGNMATYDDEMNAPAIELEDTTPYNFTPEEQQLIYQLGMEQSNTQYYDDPTGGAGGLGTNQNPSMYGNLTIGQLQRLLGAGGGGARQPATQSALQRLLSGFTGRQPSLQLGGAAGQLGSLLGGLVQTTGGTLQSQKSAAASEEQARMISEATGRAVPGAQFRPIGTTTRFGTSQFQVDPTTGQLTSAGYQLTPELKAMQDRVMALTGQGLTEAEQAAGRYAPLTAGAQGLFGLGQQYLAKSPEQVAADYMARQQDLLAPSRERQLAQLQTQLFNTGRGGLSVGGTGMRPGGGQGLRAASPEMEAYYNALAQQDAALAAQATQAGQQQVQFGAGLMGTGANLLGAYGQGLTGAYAPFSTGIGVGTSLEALGQQPLSISQQLAQLSSASGARAGELGIRGTTAAAAARLPSMQFNPLADVLSSAGKNTQFGNLLGEFTNRAFPGLFGAGTTINPLRTDEFGTDVSFRPVNPLEPEEQRAQDEMLKNYQDQAAAYRARGGQGLYIPGVTG
jgi:hypothetical protein